MEITKETLLKIKQGHVRQLKKEHGAMDGRFMTKVVKNKKDYKRHEKHKNRFI